MNRRHFLAALVAPVLVAAGAARQEMAPAPASPRLKYTARGRFTLTRDVMERMRPDEGAFVRFVEGTLSSPIGGRFEPRS